MGVKVIEVSKRGALDQRSIPGNEGQPDTRVLAGIVEHDPRLKLLYEVGLQVGSVSENRQWVEQITQMTQKTMRAAASSVLLLDEKKEELVFEIAEGEAGAVLKQVRMSIHSGIAGWVARNGKPLMVNDVKKDRFWNKDIDKSTGFITRSIMCAPLLAHNKMIGVLEVLNKLDGSDFTEQDLETLVSVASSAAISIENSRLQQSVIDGCKSTIKALAATIDAKDPYTCGHSQRVVEYALLGGVSLSLSRGELEVIEYAGILHDVGKIGIPDYILAKPGQLTDEEYRIIRKHPIISANIIDAVPFLEAAKKLILHHHERYDGLGYPDGLEGDEVPIGAYLLAVADTFDAITTDRPYRAALSIQHAIAELHRSSGTQLCPIAVDAFVSAIKRKSSAQAEHPLVTQKPVAKTS
jgi:HD-GYP domain-containing protein (c-di-GMP phosphodiesterase class II)